jgi:hypothetical protein
VTTGPVVLTLSEQLVAQQQTPATDAQLRALLPTPPGRSPVPAVAEHTVNDRLKSIFAPRRRRSAGDNSSPTPPVDPSGRPSGDRHYGLNTNLVPTEE